MSDEYYEDFVFSGNFKAMIDLTPAEGGLVAACALAKVPVLVVAFNEHHKNMIFRHVVKKIFQAMLKKDSSIFEPDLLVARDKSCSDLASRRSNMGVCSSTYVAEGATGANNSAEADPKARPVCLHVAS